MMESPIMSQTLAGKNLDDDGQAANGPVAVRDEMLNVGQIGAESENVVSNVDGDVVSIEGKSVGFHNSACVVNEEGNLMRSVEPGKIFFNKVTKCSELGIEAGSENAGGEMKEDAVFSDSLEVLEDVRLQEAYLRENVTMNGDAMEITVDKLVDEVRPQLVKDDVMVGVSSALIVNGKGDGLKDEADRSSIFVGKQDVVEEEGSFSAGDLVWSMAKNNIWWPGLICDLLVAPKQAMKSCDPNKLLVRHFGSKTMVWCPPSHLKHFLESFKEMSVQSKSKSFLGAIDKAAEEIGRRVKLEMTCSCISKEIRARLIGRNKDDFKPWYASNETVAVHFDTTSFIQRVKNLARMSYVPGIVETVATQSNISAYYSYMGHSQMYLRHLREDDGPSGVASVGTAEEGVIIPTERTDEGFDSGNEKGSDRSFDDVLVMEESPKLSAEKGVESRERKKSKYLSYPFVDLSFTRALRYPTDSSEGSGKHGASSSKRSLGKISKYASPTDYLSDSKVSSAQLLKELCDASRGCFYLNGNTILYSALDFFCEFRRFAFSDGDSGSNWYNDDGITEKEGLEIQVASPLSEVKPTKKRKKFVTDRLEALNKKPTMDQVKDVNLKAGYATPVPKSRKRKESTNAHQTNKTNGVPDLNGNGDALRNLPANLSYKNTVPEADNALPKRRKNEPGIAASEHELENDMINAKPISLVVDLFFDSHSLADLMEANVDRLFLESPASLNSYTAPSLSENLNPKNPEQMDSLLPPAEAPSGLPDLNGNRHDKDPKQPEPASGGQELPLSVIRNNLDTMTKILDQSGSSLSPEMRAKLEMDVQSLLKKIKDMTCTS